MHGYSSPPMVGAAAQLRAVRPPLLNLVGATVLYSIRSMERFRLDARESLPL